MHCTLSLTVCKCTPCQRASFNSTTDSFSWGHDPYTLACKARPSSDRCWTSLSVSMSLSLQVSRGESTQCTWEENALVADNDLPGEPALKVRCWCHANVCCWLGLAHACVLVGFFVVSPSWLPLACTSANTQSPETNRVEGLWRLEIFAVGTLTYRKNSRTLLFSEEHVLPCQVLQADLVLGGHEHICSELGRDDRSRDGVEDSCLVTFEVSQESVMLASSVQSTSRRPEERTSRGTASVRGVGRIFGRCHGGQPIARWLFPSLVVCGPFKLPSRSQVRRSNNGDNTASEHSRRSSISLKVCICDTVETKTIANQIFPKLDHSGNFYQVSVFK